MSIVLLNEKRIVEDWRQMSITTPDRLRFNKIVRYLGESHATSTYMVSLHMRESCDVIRRDLKRMEKRGYVVSDSNGSNNIYWSLQS